MPVASSSRRSRNTRRAPSSDGIEEEEPSQRQITGDVDEDGIEAPRSTKPKRGKKIRQRQSAADSDTQADDVNDNPLEDFQDQPVDKAVGTKNLTGMAGDWGQLRTGVHKNAYNLLTEVAGTVAEFTQGESSEKVRGGSELLFQMLLTPRLQYIKDLEDTMRSLVDLDNEMHAYETALQSLHQEIARGEEIVGLSIFPYPLN